MARSHWLLAASALALLTHPASASPTLELKVVGTAHLQARASATATTGTVVIHGMLTDDRGEPLPGAVVNVHPSVLGGSLESCPSSGAAAVSGLAPRAAVTTDAQGRFCAAWVAPQLDVEPTIGLRFAGSDEYQSTSIQIPLDRRHRAISLRFAPAPQQLALEQPVHTILVDTVLQQGALAEELTESIPVFLSLEEDPRTGPLPLASTMVRAGETARLELKGTQLRGSGPATLAASTPGTNSIEAARTSVTVLRTAEVTLSVLSRHKAPLVYEEPLVIQASAVGSTKPRGAIELSLPGIPAITAPLVSGRATLSAPRSHAFRGSVAATYRYLPDGPAWKPKAALDIVLVVTPPSPWRHVPWALAAAGIVGWLARSWRRPRASTQPRPGVPPQPSGVPELQVLRQGALRDGWSGLVLDAHDGRPVPDALVELQLPSFGGIAPAVSARTASDGCFSLKHTPIPEGTRIRVSARLHAPFQRPVPPPGTLKISLVTHRRQILKAFVAWVRGTGRSLRLGEDPTPRELYQKATTLDAPEIARWALETERTAFGAEPVTTDAAQRVEALEREGSPAQPVQGDRLQHTKTSPSPFQR